MFVRQNGDIKMADDELKEVSLRLQRLEEKLDTVTRRKAADSLTASDIEVFHKVQNAFWEDGTCGINETSPCVWRCNIWKDKKIVPIPVPKPCDFECTCGPCNIGSGAFGSGLARFGRMGG